MTDHESSSTDSSSTDFTQNTTLDTPSFRLEDVHNTTPDGDSSSNLYTGEAPNDQGSAPLGKGKERGT